MAMSKSAQAVMWLAADPARTQAEAAELYGVARSTISRALEKRRGADTCPCCGQTMNEGAKRGPKSAPARSQ